jgi:hypothetical protein
MEGDKVGFREKVLERVDLSGRTKRHDRDHVIVDDAHAECLCEDRELSADVTVSDDTERLASDLPAALGHLVPDTLLELARAVRELTRERNDLADDEFGDGARVGKGRVEDGDTLLGRAVEVDLVRPDAEAADDEELHASGERANQASRS